MKPSSPQDPTHIADVLAFLEQDQPHALERLRQWLAIPSISTDPAHGESVRQAAVWAQQRLEACGLNASVLPTAGHPVVFADTPEHLAPTDAPTVLFYGHYDVQPPDPLELWRTPPFEPDIRNGAIHARGASDDKGQVACFLEALHAWKQVHGRLPCRVKVLIEGEEEMGSVHLGAFLEEHRKTLAADVVLVCDTSMWEVDDHGPQPAITYGLRGLVYFDLQLHGPDRDLHSGVYGGTVANPCTILTRILGRLFDEQHRVTIPGFYDDVLPLTDAERQQWTALGFDERDYLKSIGVQTPYGEAGYSTLERRWCRPSCEINGLYGGYMGTGAKTVIPAFAGAKVSFRIVANQNPARIARDFEAWLHSHDTHGLRWQLTHHGEAAPVITPTDSPWVRAAGRAIEQTFGRKPVLVREGATIPVAADFKRILGLDTMFIGFGRPNDNLHAPNEKFDLACFRQGCRTTAALLHELHAGR